MRVRLNHLAIILFAATALLLSGGCAKTSAGKKSRGAPDPLPSASGHYEEVSEETLQSYAHFAAGLSFDLRNDPNAALGEYAKAVERDPAHEPLTLEVARRFLRSNEP